jgi:trigger factor
MVDEQIKSIRQRMGSHSHPENIGPDDLVDVQIKEIDDEGNEKEGGLDKKKMITISTLKPELIREQFIEKASGDKVTIKFSELTGEEEDIAGLLELEQENAADFKSDVEFTIEEIHRNEPAEMNEEFFKSAFGEECDTEEKFREKVKESIDASLVPESDKLFMNYAIKKLMEDLDIALPEDFLKRLILENDDKGMTEEELDSQFDGYVKSLRWQLIEGKIAREKDVKVEEQEIRDVVKGYFMSQMPFQEDDEEANERMNSIIDSVLKNEEERRNIHDRLYETKIKDALKSSLKLNEKTVSYDEFVELANESNKNA